MGGPPPPPLLHYEGPLGSAWAWPLDRYSRRGRFMRIRWFGSISVALVLAIALLLTGCGGGGGGQGGGGGGGGEQITGASGIPYPPFEVEKKGKPGGFDIDLM